MGHYSTMKCNLKIKDKKSLRNLRSKISRFNRNQPENMKESEYLYLKDCLWDLTIRADLSLEWPNENHKFYATEELADFIKKYVTAGEMIFTGEDGWQRGYHFTGNGGVIGSDQDSGNEEVWELIRGKNGL